METATASVSTTVVFSDPLGERRHSLDPGVDPLEFLCLGTQLTAAPSFEEALRERVRQLTGFSHAYYARVRSIEPVDGMLAIVSERVEGLRLSRILDLVARERLTLDINTALSLIRQLVPAVAALHEHSRDTSHGAIGAERLILTTRARLVIVEHVLGSALAQLGYSAERYWRELHIPVPHASGPAPFNQRVDVMQMGIVVLSLVMGRQLRAHEYPDHLPALVASVWAISAAGGLEPLPPGLRSWLSRALQLDPRDAFRSAFEASTELERLIGNGDYIVPSEVLETFLADCQAACIDEALWPVRPETPAPAVSASSIAVTTAPSLVDDLPPSRAERASASLTGAFGPGGKAGTTHAGNDEVRLQADAPYAHAEGTHMAKARRRWPRVAAIAVIAIASASGAALAARRYLPSAQPVPPLSGTLIISTNPAGAEIAIDGEARGAAPVTLSVSPGVHTVEFRGAGEPRSVQVTVAPGAQVAQYFELPQASVGGGHLHVRTEPPGARVSVDGAVRGPSPITILNLPAGAHVVTLDSEGGPVRQEVTIQTGATASLVVPLAPSSGAATSGWIAVRAPISVQLFEDGRLLGSSESDRIMLAAGKHEIEIVSQPLAFRIARSVQVAPGKTAAIDVELPSQLMAINAIPWAEVWIDGLKAGDTPIGDFPVTIGPHEIVFRHPALGEQRHAVTVTAGSPIRVSVDLRKQVTP